MGDYPMFNEEALRSQLTSKTSLILGDVATTASEFVAKQEYPVGFVAFDLDYYSSTMNDFNIFRSRDRKMLAHVPLYFDDISFYGASAYAGELLAIREFNADDNPVKIDPWPALRFNRPFSDSRWLSKMYVANDMEKVEKLSTLVRHRDRW
jgi:hypothetical protein